MGRPRTASDPDGLIRFLRAGGRAGGRRDTSAAAVGVHRLRKCGREGGRAVGWWAVARLGGTCPPPRTVHIRSTNSVW
jgi:hypothetical protein